MYSWFTHLIQIDITKIRNQCTKCWHIIDTDWSNLLCYIMIMLSNLAFIFRDPKHQEIIHYISPLFSFTHLSVIALWVKLLMTIFPAWTSVGAHGAARRLPSNSKCSIAAWSLGKGEKQSGAREKEVERKRNVKQRKEYRAKL